jgi:hypothetical protein
LRALYSLMISLLWRLRYVYRRRGKFGDLAHHRLSLWGLAVLMGWTKSCFRGCRRGRESEMGSSVSWAISVLISKTLILNLVLDFYDAVPGLVEAVIGLWMFYVVGVLCITVIWWIMRVFALTFCKFEGSSNPWAFRPKNPGWIDCCDQSHEFRWG